MPHERGGKIMPAQSLSFLSLLPSRVVCIGLCQDWFSFSCFEEATTWHMSPQGGAMATVTTL